MRTQIILSATENLKYTTARHINKKKTQLSGNVQFRKQGTYRKLYEQILIEYSFDGDLMEEGNRTNKILHYTRFINKNRLFIYLLV